MNTRILRLQKPDRETIRSKIMFGGNFKQALREAIETIESSIEEDCSALFPELSVIAGNSGLKIRLRDEHGNILGIVSCIFRFHHDEMKYGNVFIDIGVQSLSQKSSLQVVGKFSITDYDSMRKGVIPPILEHLRDLEK